MVHITVWALGRCRAAWVSGAVGVSVLQQARVRNARVVGTSSDKSVDLVPRFGGEHVLYGEGPEGATAESFTRGMRRGSRCRRTDDVIDVSLALVETPQYLSGQRPGRTLALLS